MPASRPWSARARAVAFGATNPRLATKTNRPAANDGHGHVPIAAMTTSATPAPAVTWTARARIRADGRAGQRQAIHLARGDEPDGIRAEQGRVLTGVRPYRSMKTNGEPAM